MHVNKKKDILILGEGLIQGLDNTTLTISDYHKDLLLSKYKKI